MRFSVNMLAAVLAESVNSSATMMNLVTIQTKIILLLL